MDFDIGYISILAAGLPEDSRVFKGISDMPVSSGKYILMKIADELSIIRWTLTATKGQKKPELITENLSKQKSKQEDSKKYKAFSSPEEFDKAWKAGIK